MAAALSFDIDLSCQSPGCSPMQLENPWLQPATALGNMLSFPLSLSLPRPLTPHPPTLPHQKKKKKNLLPDPFLCGRLRRQAGLSLVGFFKNTFLLIFRERNREIKLQ